MAKLPVTKKVRMDRATATKLRRLAARRGLSESEVIRQAVAQMHAANDREALVARLQEVLGPEPPKVRFRLE